MVEVAGQPADDRLVARIGKAQPAAGQATQVPVRADEHDRAAHLLHLHRRDHAGRGAAVDDHVGRRLLRFARLRRERTAHEQRTESEHDSSGQHGQFLLAISHNG